MIFKIDDDGEKIVSFFNKAKIESEKFSKQLEKDKAFLNEYFKYTGDVSKQQDILNRYMDEASESAKDYATNLKGNAGSAKIFEEQQLKTNSVLSKSKKQFDLSTISANAYKIALKGITLLANMASGAILSGIVFAFSKLFTAQQEAIDKGKELSNAFNSDNQALETYKTRINTLTTELNSSNISYEDSKSKRKELMTIQDELIKKYGTEETVIRSITDAINGEVDALDNLSQSAYYEWLASVDDLTGWQEFGNGFFTLTTGITDQYKSALDSAVDYMEDKTQTFFVKLSGNESLDNIIKEKFGLETNAFDEFVIKDIVPEEAYELLGEIRTAYRENATEYLGAETDNILKTVNDSIQSSMTTIDAELKNHQKTYHTYLEGMIKYDSEYSDEYADLLAKRADLEETQLSPDDENKHQRVMEASKAFYDSLENAITASENNDNVKRYFENLYPDLYAEMKNWTFQFNLEANTDSLGDEAKALGEKYSATDLFDMINTDGTQEGEEAFRSLIKKTKTYGICTSDSAEEVQKLIDLLVKLGIVQDDVQGSQPDKTYTPFDIETFKSTITELESGYKSLLDAKQEYEDNGGFLSPSTIASLTESGLIQYLEQTSEGLRFNTDAYLENSEVIKQNAIQQLYSAMCHDIESIAIGNTADISSIAQTAIANAGLSAETAGNQASDSASGWYDLATSIATVKASMSDDVQGATGNTKKQIDETIKAYQNIARMVENINVGKTTGSANKSSSAAKSAEDTAKESTQKAKEYVDAYMDFMGKSLDASKIDYNTYSNSVSNFLKQMFKDGKISAADYFSYIHDMTEKQLSVYQSALNGVIKLLDDEIDKWQDKIDTVEKHNDVLNKQKDNYDAVLAVVDSVYQKEIDRINEQKDLLQDKINAINDENNALELQKRKQEALIAVERSREQRKVKMYAEGKGFFYTQNQDDIRDAEGNLKDIETEETIKKLEDEQKLLDESIDILQQYKDKWAEISDAHQNEINKQLAIDLWGQNYEKLILMNRTQDIEAFKENYLHIQSQIDDNTSMIESYEEKILYYENLKTQWEAITTARQDALDKQHAADLLGAQWESDVLSGRMDILNSFRDEYIQLQQDLADAAWESANEQIKAAKEAAKAAQGNIGGAGNIGSNSGKSDNTYYKVVDKDTGEEIIKGFTSEESADRFASQVDDAIHENVEVVEYSKKYASGTNHATRGLNMVGEKGMESYEDKDGNISLISKPTLIPMEGGEKVYNAKDTRTLLEKGELIPLSLKGVDTAKFEKLFQSINTNAVMPSYVKPDYSYLGNVVNNRNTQQSVTQNINVTLPNVTNETGFNNFKRELDRLKLDAYQYSHRRH